MLAWRTLWKDWGFAEQILNQSKLFIELAKSSKNDIDESSCIRASIIFSLMSFEAHFTEAVRGFIQINREKLDPKQLAQVEDDERAPISRALERWPELLTGKPFDMRTEAPRTYTGFREYRNALIHGKITEKIPSVGKIAQEMETIDNAQLANAAVSQMIKLVSSHFGFEVPKWA